MMEEKKTVLLTYPIKDVIKHLKEDSVMWENIAKEAEEERKKDLELIEKLIFEEARTKVSEVV